MQSHIRNFAIIAHIDHGKSTLADRLLEMTGTIAKRDMQAQILDSNPIERERGITIKLAPVRMKYKSQNSNHNTQQGKRIMLDIGNSDLRFEGSDYILNLIDTPGHVDFGYEVSRSLAACEGALLVVDATQGVQAQTLANLNQAREHNLAIIPIINKIDMPTARIGDARRELRSLEFRDEDILEISAKTGENVDEVLKKIIEKIPPPKGDLDAPLRALIFSSQYDTHKGVVVFVKIVDGHIPFTSSTRLQFMASGASVTPIELGYFIPQMHTIGSGNKLSAGEVGYIATGLKDVRFAKVGDTIILNDTSATALAGYKDPKPMVFLRLFPINTEEFSYARETLEKLRLSDSAFTFRPISSAALGNGFHCGFLGLLHAEIVQERLSREFDLNMIATAPSVEYHLKKTSGEEVSIQSAAEFPDPTSIKEVCEPIMKVTIYTPKRYVGPVMQLAQEKRGTYVDLTYTADPASSAGGHAEFTYLLPLSEMIIDFFDRLKSVTEGYASLDYEFFDYQAVDLAKIDILVNHEKVDALSFLVVRDQAHTRAVEITDRLAAVIPRQQFEVPIQGAIGGKVVARSDVKAFRKDVIAKLYGGDRTRKDKLLKKQKKGKARMKLIGRVEIPQEAFFEVLKRE
jgi:GTP-binding protein LepA